MRSAVTCLLLAALMLVPEASFAAPIVVDFESFGDLDSVGNQLPGLSFTNATVLTSGLSLNDLETPAHSGANAVFDDSGPITIAFDTPFLKAGGFFTYFAPVTLEAFDSGNLLIATVTSAFASNSVLSGDAGSSANEFLELSSTLGISFLRLTGSGQGGSFVLDDLTLTPSDTTTAPVPEPSTLSLLALGGGMAWRRLRRRA